MSISPESIQHIVDQFWATEAQYHPLTRVTSLYPELTPTDAYQVQAELIKRFEAQGYKAVGKKIAATGAAAQAKMGLTEPVYGTLFAQHEMANGAAIPSQHFIHGAIECELAFMMGKTLQGPQVTADDVLAATREIRAAFDIVDFRTTAWQVGFGEAICYNVFYRHFVLSEWGLPPAALDLAQLPISLLKHGQPVAEVVGGAIMGHPARAIAWAVNKLAEHGRALEAGEFILTGAITPPYVLHPGDTFSGTFDQLGQLNVSFV